MQIIKYKYWFLLFSGLILIPGLISLLIFGLRLSIDFTGGSVIRYQFQKTEASADVAKVLNEKNVGVESISQTDENTLVIRTKLLEPSKIDEVKQILGQTYTGSTFKSFETVGPTIGRETTKNSFTSLAWASVGILIYIAYVFRNIPKPYSSFRFGVSAIVAMLHDVLVVLGIFSILGHLFNIEIDALFITAMLTVIGFSVHDTIVVFDRIRENLSKLPYSMSFEEVVNFSVVETLNRSLATSLTVLLTLFSLYLLGGLSIKNFVLAMLIGITSGTYSSIFTASPLLVIWEDWIANKTAKKK